MQLPPVNQSSLMAKWFAVNQRSILLHSSFGKELALIQGFILAP